MAVVCAYSVGYQAGRDGGFSFSFSRHVLPGLVGAALWLVFSWGRLIVDTMKVGNRKQAAFLILFPIKLFGLLTLLASILVLLVWLVLFGGIDTLTRFTFG
jgi:hypothetical protein